ncbi:MAG: 6-phosphogluconate dehydrogenase, partial [Flavobacteriaceae bacterium]
SRKGVIAKTWEGEISQGISGAQIFPFSVQDNEKKAIQQLQEYQGHYVKVYYTERYATFFWLGDTKYFITKVEKERSPHFRE